ncbi:MAG: glycosyltransferase N-terminal domain-containing protein, partial [bacterium]
MTRHQYRRKIYNRVVLPGVYGLAHVAAAFRPKLRASLAERKGVNERWLAAGKTMTERPIWFHVASVGEYEQARPLITALGRTRPEIPVVISFTSPSGFHYARTKEQTDGADNVRFVDYLPIDFADNIRLCLQALDPRLLVFVKFDLWPNLVWESAEGGVPMVLIDATLSETSNRYRAFGRRFYDSVYEKLDKILAISDLDAQRFRECVPGHPGIAVAGDTRFDRVMERKRALGRSSGQVDKNGRLVVLAGSTWPKDEVHLLGALARVTKASNDILTVIAPHEPAEERVADLMEWAAANSLRAVTLGAIGAEDHRTGGEQVVVVDSVGVLAELYESADLAYVGGSFSSGVHNVIEPAIMGIPVLFGPVNKNSFEALELLRNDAAIQVETEKDIFDALSTLLRDDGKRADMGRRARAFVESHLGATDRCLSAIQE